MTEYQIIIHRKNLAFIKELQPSYQNKIRDILKTLGSNPFAYPYTKIRGEEHIFRIRVGEYRILYEVHTHLRQVIILKIDTRSKVYK
ncbi:MAG: type II toxin-antitoxin system RelE/ParE family toxin [Methanospirillaceae archaeon]|nr:type II toxin-antitoxin system RelE/ParE family toxin [Methanospirillaceae archaeon]